MAQRDYYEILGVERTVDAAVLKSAYRKLAMEHHPDRNGGSEESVARFKEISEAYTVLSDEQKRAAYDRFGHAGVGGGAGGGLHASAKGVYEITPAGTRFIPATPARYLLAGVVAGFLLKAFLAPGERK